MAGLQLEHLLEGAARAVPIVGLQARQAFVEGLFHLAVALGFHAARALDAARRLLVVDVDQEDPRPHVDRGLGIAGVQRLLPLGKQLLDAALALGVAGGGRWRRRLVRGESGRRGARQPDRLGLHLRRGGKRRRGAGGAQPGVRRLGSRRGGGRSGDRRQLGDARMAGVEGARLLDQPVGVGGAPGAQGLPGGEQELADVGARLEALLGQRHQALQLQVAAHRRGLVAGARLQLLEAALPEEGLELGTQPGPMGLRQLRQLERQPFEVAPGRLRRLQDRGAGRCRRLGG